MVESARPPVKVRIPKSVEEALGRWKRTNILVVSRIDTHAVVAMPTIMHVTEGTFIGPTTLIGRVFTGLHVSMEEKDWWDELKSRSVDKRINFL